MSDVSWLLDEHAAPRSPLGRRPLDARALAAAEPLLEVAGIGAWQLTPGGKLWWSNRTRQIHGVSAGYVPTLDVAISFYVPEHQPLIAEAVRHAMDNGAPWDLELAIRRADGDRRQVRARGRAVQRQAGASTYLVGTFEDITDRHLAAMRAASELELRTRTETLLRDVITAIPTALSVYDRDERLILVNENYRNILPGNRQFMVTGESLENIIARKVLANHYVPEVSADDPPQVRAAWVAEYLRQHRQPGYNRIFQLRDDKFVQATAAISESGNIVSVRWDVSALKRAERALRQRAERDALTGLANRDVLLSRLTASAQGSEPGLLVLLDIDFFKAVNDSLGHAAGDQLLRIIGRRLRMLIGKVGGPGSIAARLSGDEFAMIINRTVELDKLNEIAANLMTHMRRPMQLGASRYAPSVSVGIAPIPVEPSDPKVLMANADAALLDAKRLGRGRHVVFSAALAERVIRRTRLAEALRQALAEGSIQAALQPQQRLENGSVLGFEALARWQLGSQWVPPAEFIGLAEDVGLAQSLGNAVMEAAFAGFAAMLRAGLDPGHLAINVSTAQLLADDFVETVKAALSRHDVPATRLEIEVTETVLLDRSIARIGQTLEALQAMGCTLAMDDFGTGYASLSHLTAFPVDRIKIDRGFTHAIDSADGSGLIARSLIQLGGALGLEVIAEGVETERQREFLVANGCAAIQGFLFARPMLPDAALAWLAALQPVA